MRTEAKQMKLDGRKIQERLGWMVLIFLQLNRKMYRFGTES